MYDILELIIASHMTHQLLSLFRCQNLKEVGVSYSLSFCFVFLITEQVLFSEGICGQKGILDRYNYKGKAPRIKVKLFL
jgi:hypothetical protein